MIVFYARLSCATLSTCIGLLILAVSGCKDGQPRGGGDDKGTPRWIRPGEGGFFVKAEVGSVQFEPG